MSNAQIIEDGLRVHDAGGDSDTLELVVPRCFRSDAASADGQMLMVTSWWPAVSDARLSRGLGSGITAWTGLMAVGTLTGVVGLHVGGIVMPAVFAVLVIPIGLLAGDHFGAAVSHRPALIQLGPRCLTCPAGRWRWGELNGVYRDHDALIVVGKHWQEAVWKDVHTDRPSDLDWLVGTLRAHIAEHAGEDAERVDQQSAARNEEIARAASTRPRRVIWDVTVVPSCANLLLNDELLPGADLSSLSMGIARHPSGGQAYLEYITKRPSKALDKTTFIHSPERCILENDDEASLLALERWIARRSGFDATLIDGDVPFAFRPPDPVLLSADEEVLYLCEVVSTPRSWLARWILGDETPFRHEHYAGLHLSQQGMNWSGDTLEWKELKAVRLEDKDMVFDLRDGTELSWEDIAFLRREDLDWLHQRILYFAHDHLYDEAEERQVREGANALEQRR